MTRSVGIVIFPEVEVLDFAGPFEVFCTASRVYLRSQPGDDPPFEVKVIAEEMGPIQARGGLQVFPDSTFSKVVQLDVLLVPGGVIYQELDNKNLIEWIQSIHPGTELTTSVCTGSFLLAKAGLLDGLQATSHWEDLDELMSRFPEVEVLSERRWVEQGKIITSAGISAGIDMSLQLVAMLQGRDLALRTAQQMDYRWVES